MKEQAATLTRVLLKSYQAVYHVKPVEHDFSSILSKLELSMANPLIQCMRASLDCTFNANQVHFNSFQPVVDLHEKRLGM